MDELAEAYEKWKGDNRRAIDDRKIKFVLKEFSHHASVEIVNGIAQIEANSQTFEGGVCLGLAFAYLGHRRFKNVLSALAGASGEDDAEDMKEFAANYYRIFKQLTVDNLGATRKFTRKMSPEKVGALAYDTHKPVHDAMVEQRDFTRKKGEALKPIQDRQADLMKAKWEDLAARKEDLAARKKDPDRPRSGDGPIEKMERDLRERELKLLQTEGTMLFNKMTREFMKGLGEKFMGSLILCPDVIKADSGSRWEQNDKFNASRFNVGYHLLETGGHAMALAINHGANSFKFFDPNGGIVASDDFALLIDFVPRYVGENYGSFQAWSWFG